MQLFLLPAKAVWIVGITTIAFCLAFGRFLAMDGFYWNTLAAIAFAALTAYVTSQQVGLRQLGISDKRWLRSAFLWTALGAVALALVGALSATFAQRFSGYYRSFDPWVVTRGTAVMTDTRGALYSLTGAGVSLSSVVWTSLVFFSVLIMAGAIGLALGRVTAARGALGAMLAMAASILAGVLVIIVLDAFGVRISAPLPGVFLFCLPTAVVALLVVWAAPRLRKG